MKKNLKHLPLILVAILTMGLLLFEQEYLIFEMLLVSQAAIVVILLAYHRQIAGGINPAMTWPWPSVLIHLVLLAGSCSFFFFLPSAWPDSQNWFVAAQKLMGPASDVTVNLGIAIATITILGSLILRKGHS